jgi:hypothetical protein
MDAVWRGHEVAWCTLLPFGVLSGEFDLVGEPDIDGSCYAAL